MTHRRPPPPGWVPRLVALDLDGTVIGGDGEISPAVRDAVGAAARAGAHVVVATGRSLHATRPVADDLGLVGGWAVCSNGAVTATLPPSERIVEVVTFDAGPAVSILREHLSDALYAVEVLGRGYRVTDHFPDGELGGEVVVEPLERLVSEPVTRVVVRSPDRTPDDFLVLMERIGLQGVGYAVGHTAWLDITPDGVSKASAMERVRRELGVASDETFAIGDGRNDIEMLRWAAHSVAMGQAVAEVQDAADEVTLTFADEGLAVALGRYFGDGLPRRHGRRG